MDGVTKAIQDLDLDRPTATMIVVEDAAERHFIAESLVTAAALFLLQQYAVGFLRGLGADALAERHGKACHDLFEKIRDRSVDDRDLRDAMVATTDAIAAVKDEKTEHSKGVAASETAAQEIVALLQDVGVPKRSASRVAERTRNAFAAD